MQLREGIRAGGHKGGRVQGKEGTKVGGRKGRRVQGSQMRSAASMGLGCDPRALDAVHGFCLEAVQSLGCGQHMNLLFDSFFRPRKRYHVKQKQLLCVAPNISR